MNVVTGIFTAEEAAAVVNYFTKSGFLPESVAVISSPMEMPAYLDGEPEQAATTGAVTGGVAGGTLGALTILVASTIPAFRAMPVIAGSESLVIFGLMTTAVGSVVGGYLGSMYSVRASSEPQINMVELLDTGHVVLVVTTEGGAKAETAVALMHQLGGRQIEIHPLPTENNEAIQYS
ncbi:MAG: hypothetical protein KJ069_02415 [Anaerolineae bacterium]|nr:hypothetical protein [Anaerolineae bacterium]